MSYFSRLWRWMKLPEQQRSFVCCLCIRWEHWMPLSLSLLTSYSFHHEQSQFCLSELPPYEPSIIAWVSSEMSSVTVLRYWRSRFSWPWMVWSLEIMKKNVLVSYKWHSQVLQAAWINTMEFYSLLVLVARCLGLVLSEPFLHWDSRCSLFAVPCDSWHSSGTVTSICDIYVITAICHTVLS